jgi:hypothetical protein
MAITLKKITLWRKEVDDKPGALADTLALLAQARTDLQAVMGYRHPGDQDKATIELHPTAEGNGPGSCARAAATGSSFEVDDSAGDDDAVSGQRFRARAARAGQLRSTRIANAKSAAPAEGSIAAATSRASGGIEPRTVSRSPVMKTNA